MHCFQYPCYMFEPNRIILEHFTANAQVKVEEAIGTEKKNQWPPEGNM